MKTLFQYISAFFTFLSLVSLVLLFLFLIKQFPIIGAILYIAGTLFFVILIIVLIKEMMFD